MPELQKYMKLEDVSCVHVPDTDVGMYGLKWETLFQIILIFWGRSDNFPVSLKNDSMQQPE